MGPRLTMKSKGFIVSVINAQDSVVVYSFSFLLFLKTHDTR
jgi:hypothetical protein